VEFQDFKTYSTSQGIDVDWYYERNL
jgi:hypothetical protein